MNYYYDNYVVDLSKKFLNRLDDIKANYNFDLGDEFEIAICELLRQFLPLKYGICRGFVVDQDGKKAGDDIIIFDQIQFPTIRTHLRNDFSRKEQIPIEAVYAYIEAKHTLNKETLNKSINQIVAIKGLCYGRVKTDLFQVDPSVGEFVDRGNLVESLPKFRNPVLGIILSRYAVDENDEKSDNPQAINNFLVSNKPKIYNHQMLAPELLIAGKDNLLAIGYKKDKKETLTLFHPDNGLKIGYQGIIKEDLAFGILLSRLIAGLNWIRLG